MKNAKFALYRLICSDPSHGGKHDKDLIRHDENGVSTPDMRIKIVGNCRERRFRIENGTVEFLNLPAEEGTEYRRGGVRKLRGGYVDGRKVSRKVTYEKETHELED